MFSGPIEDRLGIRELFDSYGDAVTRNALDDYLACWTEDGTRLGEGGECEGIEGLACALGRDLEGVVADGVCDANRGDRGRR